LIREADDMRRKAIAGSVRENLKYIKNKEFLSAVSAFAGERGYHYE